MRRVGQPGAHRRAARDHRHRRPARRPAGPAATWGLAPCSPRALRRRLEAGHWPVAYGYSPTVVPRPDDWRPGLEVTGYWFAPHPVGWQPWAQRLTSLGISPGPQPFRRLSPEGLAAAVRRAVSEPQHRERAAWIAERLAREDGPGRVVAIVEAAGGGHGRDRTTTGHPVRATTR